MATIRIARFWSPRPEPSLVAAAVRADGLAAFGSETAPVPAPRLVEVPAPAPETREEAGGVERPSRGAAAEVMKWALVAVLGASAGIGGLKILEWRRAAGVQLGTVAINTNPPGADVRRGGASVGTTPLTLQLSPGEYEFEVAGASSTRAVRVSVGAGASLTRDIDLPVAAPAVPALATITIQTDPAGLPVLVDGRAKGKAPVTVEGLSVGGHQIVVRGRSGDIRRSVSLSAGQTLSLLVAGPEPAPAAAAAGWLTISSPIPMQVREGGRVIGSTESERLMLSAGVHEIELVNELLGYRETRKVAIAASRTSPFQVELPNGMLSINALPWAEVWIDGERVGETPIANIQRRIGAHEIVFKHPEFGERRETVMIAVGRPTRLGIDMRGRRP